MQWKYWRRFSELSFNYFESRDIVRHPVVAKVVQAYEKWEERTNCDVRN